MKRWPITFAIILPLAEIFVAAVILAVPALVVFLKLVSLAHGTGVAHMQFGQFSRTIPREDFVSFAAQTSSFGSSHLLTALNMPGFLGELLVDLPTAWPESWRPAGVSLESWRALIWPVFSLPAWLLVGYGVDALLGWRKLHWSVLLTGTLLCVISVVLLAGLTIMYFTSERDDSAFILWGFSLWSALFATLPAVWIRRWRSRRAEARAARQAAVAEHV